MFFRIRGLSVNDVRGGNLRANFKKLSFTIKISKKLKTYKNIEALLNF